MQAKLEKKIKQYQREIDKLNSEPARPQRFLLLLNDIFGSINTNFVEDYLQGLEKYVKSKSKISYYEVE